GADSVTITTTGNGSAGDIYLRDVQVATASDYGSSAAYLVATDEDKATKAQLGLGDFALSTTGTGAQTVSIEAAGGHILVNDDSFDGSIGTDNIILTTKGASAHIVFSGATTDAARLETTQNVTLTAAQGRVYDADNNEQSVSADYLDINANKGVGGTASTAANSADPFNVDVNSLKASSEGAIYIRENDGVDVMGLTTAVNSGDIWLSSGPGGAVTIVAAGGGGTGVTAHKAGSIDIISEANTINVNNDIVSGNGDITLTDNGTITLNANITTAQTGAMDADVYLIADANNAVSGAIVYTSGTVTGDRLQASARSGIEVHTDVATLDADNHGTGDIIIVEADDLTVGSTAAIATNSGDITITSDTGNLTLAQDVIAGDTAAADGQVVLRTLDTGSLGTLSVTVNAGVTVQGGSTGGIGGVTIQTDNLNLGGTGGTAGSAAQLVSYGGIGYNTGGDVKLYPTDETMNIIVNGAGNANFVTTGGDDLADYVDVNGSGFLVIGDEALKGNINVGSTAASTFASGTNVAFITAGSVSLDTAGSGDISTTGDVYIYAGNRIIDGNADGSADILADTIYLYGGSGIGTAASATGALDIVATDVYATNSASGGVFLNILGGTGTGGTGAVNIREAHANGSGSVWIDAAAKAGLNLYDVDTQNGSITVSNSTGQVSIIGSVVSDTPVGVGTHDIAIDSFAGGIDFGANGFVKSDDQVNLSAIGGSIVSGTVGDGVDVYADEAFFNSSSSIGLIGNRLQTQVSEIDATAYNVTGSIYITEADSVTLTSVDADNGHVDIIANTGNIDVVLAISDSDALPGGSHDLSIKATNGDIIITGSVQSDRDATLIAAGDIISDGDATLDVSAINLVMYAGGTIGGSGVNVLNTTVTNVEALIVDANGA
ncbi:MAG: hypothetical protein JEZ02_22005, partial [Desulfatibacillum sp.]|nr:hypothetical protein [Desulfatibacillum sp.]